MANFFVLVHKIAYFCYLMIPESINDARSDEIFLMFLGVKTASSWSPNKHLTIKIQTEFILVEKCHLFITSIRTILVFLCTTSIEFVFFPVLNNDALTTSLAFNLPTAMVDNVRFRGKTVEVSSIFSWTSLGIFYQPFLTAVFQSLL